MDVSNHSMVSAVGLITIDEHGVIRSFDAVSERIFGYSQADMIGQNVNILMPSPYQHEHDHYLSRYLAEGAPKVIGRGREVVGKHRDGHNFPVWLAVNEVRLASERIFVGSIVELTKQKNIESDLAKSLETTRAILDTAINPIITIDAKGHICSFNPAAEQLFGYMSDELLGENIKILMPQPYHSAHDGYLARYLRDGEPHVIGKGREVLGRKKDGTSFPMHLSVGQMDVSGQPMFVGIIVDMSERKAVEAELAKSLEITRAILDTAINPIITIDAKGTVASFNPAAEWLFGYNKNEVLGQNVKVIMPEPYRAEHDGYLARYLREGEPHIIGKGREVVGRRKDGTTFPMHLSVGRMDVAGEPMFVGIIVDITDRKASEAELLQHRDRLAEMVANATSELKQAKEDAEAGARSKSAFLANMSHEIRTPMNAIIGFAEVALQDHQLSAHTREYIKTILRSSRSLLAIINDVLDVSKLESNKFMLEKVPFHLPNVLVELRNTIEHQLAEKDLNFNCEIAQDVPIRVIGDPTRLRQVLLNLIGNAIKFTEFGAITLSVSKSSTDKQLQFSIHDTGIGMTEAQAARVFDAFAQADVSTTRHYGGTGLGTTISKQLVEQMQGKIWVESTWKQGTTFHFTVTLPPIDPHQKCVNEGELSNEDYQSPRLFNILLAEDMETNASLAMLRLSQQGHHIDWAKNGREALEAVIRGGYDLVLMDVMMPEMDGLEATMRIRAYERNHNLSAIPIIALTASVMSEDFDRCLSSGMNKVEAKPIEFNSLLRTMETEVSYSTNHQQSPSTACANDPKDITHALFQLANLADVQKALAVWQNPVVYRDSLLLFAQQQQSEKERLKAAIMKVTPDYALAYQVLHALKGTAGNLYLTRIMELTVPLCHQVKSVLEGNDEFAATDEDKLFDLISELETVIIAIATLQPEQNPHHQPQLPMNLIHIEQLLSQIENGIIQYNPDIIEPLIDQLALYLSNDQLSSLKLCTQNFDFDGLTNAVRELAHRLGIWL